MRSPGRPVLLLAAVLSSGSLAFGPYSPPAVVSARQDPSFEWDSGSQPSEWRLSAGGGAAGRVFWTGEARTGKRALAIEKSNGLGTLTLTLIQPVGVTPGQRYEAAFYLRVREREYGSVTALEIADLDSGGAVVSRAASPISEQVPNFTAEGEWIRYWCRWTAGPGAATSRISFEIDGNAMTLVLDDFELIRNPPSLAREGLGNSSEPAYSERAALERLAGRTPVAASIANVGGRPEIVLGGTPVAPLIHQSPFGDYRSARYGGFGASGIHLQTAFVDLAPVADDPDGFAFTGLRANLRRALSADPDVWIILVVRCDASRQWGLTHGGDVWTAESGAKWIRSEYHTTRLGGVPGAAESYSGSYGSDAYRDHIASGLRALGRYVSSSAEGKLVVGFSLVGGEDGQWFDNSLALAGALDPGWTPAGPFAPPLDHSEGNRQGFGNWLRELYGADIRALQAAWGDTSVTFESAALCPERARYVSSPFLPPTARRAIDSQRYSQAAPVRMLAYFASVLREAIARPVFSIAYYPDAAAGMRLNKYAAAQLFSMPDRVDCGAAVEPYDEWRKPGSTGSLNAIWGTHRTRESLLIAELDYRTYRSAATDELNFEVLGAPATVEGFRAQVRRDIGLAASRGIGAWFYDMSGGWYDAPDLWSVIAEARRIMEWAHRPAAPPPSAELAVFLDEEAAYRLNPNSFDGMNAAARQRRALDLSGVPYDLYVLDDVRRADLPEYKAGVFLGAFTLTRAQVSAIKEKFRKPGKVLLFSANLGAGSLDYPDQVSLAAELTGIACTRLSPGAPLASVPVSDCGDPVCSGLTGSFLSAGVAGGSVLLPADSEAAVFGRYVNGRPSHVIKRSSGGNAILMPPWGFQSGLTPQLIHNVAVLAGIRAMGTPGQVTHIGNGVAVCHRTQPGPVTVTFEAPVDLVSLDGSTVLERAVTRWEPECGLLETDVVFYRPARPWRDPEIPIGPGRTR